MWAEIHLGSSTFDALQTQIKERLIECYRLCQIKSGNAEMHGNYRTRGHLGVLLFVWFRCNNDELRDYMYALARSENFLQAPLACSLLLEWSDGTSTLVIALDLESITSAAFPLSRSRYLAFRSLLQPHVLSPLLDPR